MSEEAQREAYRRGARGFSDEVIRRFFASNPRGSIPMKQEDIGYYIRQLDREIKRGVWPSGEWPKGDTDAN